MRKLVFACLAALLLCGQSPIASFPPGTFQSPAALAGTSTVATIQSIQACTIALNGVTSNTCTISAVTVANAVPIYNGCTNDGTNPNSGYSRYYARVALTSTTQVTATRQATSDDIVCHITVVEFKSAVVNSIQCGTITVTTSGSATATISAVGSNTFVVWEGMLTNVAGANAGDSITAVALTNSTTVTGTMSTSASNSGIVGYCAVDLASSIINSIQQRSFASTAAASSETDTITSIPTGNTILVYGGTLTDAVTSDVDIISYDNVLTNGTTTTAARSNGANTTSRTHKYTAVEFKAAALNGSVQRGTIALSAQTSKTATITSVDTTKAFVNWCGFLAASAAPNTVMPAVDLTNGTTVTASVNSAGSPTVCYEVAQFN